MIVIGKSSSQGSEKTRIRIRLQFGHEFEADDVTPTFLPCQAAKAVIWTVLNALSTIILSSSNDEDDMKLYALAVLHVVNSSATTLSSAQDLSSFSFYQRSTVAEFLTFFIRTVAERTPAGQRQSLQENNYTFHVYNRGGDENLTGEDGFIAVREPAIDC